MTDDERNDLLKLKAILTKYLAAVEQQIIDYNSDADDDKFNFLILRARRYQQALAQIGYQLQNEEEL